MAAGALLKEAMGDLEWPGGGVAISLSHALTVLCRVHMLLCAQGGY